MKQNNFFQTAISVYEGVTDTEGSICTLGDFLFTDAYKQKVLAVRNSTNEQQKKELKIKLPQATISGVFDPSRKVSNLLKHSGLICVDIDAKDNTHIENFDAIKTKLVTLKEIAYIAKSVSGNGYFCIIPLKAPTLHKLQFKQLQTDFLKHGIVIDKSCSDVCRLRCISYDPDAYVNPQAVAYRGIYMNSEPKFHRHNLVPNNSSQLVYELCTLIEKKGIDLTQSYDDWMRLGAAFSSLGEEGREAFHICSRQNSHYTVAETDRKFNNLMKSALNISIGTFIKMCRDNNINLK